MLAGVVPVPRIERISDLRVRQKEILADLSESPVVLTHHGRAAAVLVAAEQWNQLIGELEDLQDALSALESREELEPSVDLDDYLAKRGDRVQAKAGQ